MPLDTLSPALGLTETALASLRSKFIDDDHSPSTEQWSAIRDLLVRLSRGADETLEPAVYLSAIPAGTGKTATIAHFAAALMADSRRSTVGMLIACNRVDEVSEMAGLLASFRHRLCVIAGRDGEPVRDLGDHQQADAAQVVISTQAALKQSLKVLASFDDATRFHFHGRRRSVVAWDEAFQFNRPVVLNPLRAARLAEAMNRQSPAASKALLQWAARAMEANDGACDVPDFAAMGLDWRAFEEAVLDDEDTHAQARALFVISGKVGYVVRDNAGGMLVSYTPELPPSLLPVIVTDASAAVGVHHASYEQMARTRPIVRLKEAGKLYRNMAVKLVPASVSRSTFRDRTQPRGKELIEMAVSYVRRVAPDPVLIVSYRNTFQMKGVTETTIRAAIDKRLQPSERLRVFHLTWGRHTATNDHKDVRHVILLGLNYLPRAAAHAASGAAQDKDMNNPDHQPTVDQVDAMRVGMLRDSTMQAMLRGNARKAADGDCGPMTALIFQSPQTGLSISDYRGMFPGASVVRDETLMPSKPLRGRLLKLSQNVMRRVENGESRDCLRGPTD